MPDEIQGPGRQAWATAYAQQAASDFRVFRRLSELRAEDPQKMESCHVLHFLQMACEKIAKAYRFRDTDTSEEHLTSDHVAFSRFITAFLKSEHIRLRYTGKREQLQQLQKVGRKLAREIELLAPAVDRKNTPCNAEYPWPDGDELVVPCEYSFPNLSLLETPGGRSFLKTVAVAVDRFDRIRTW